jgi:DNA processing protein
MTNKEYWFWICNIDGVWREGVRKIIDEFNHPREAFECEKDEFVERMEKLSFNKSEENKKKIIETIVKSRDKGSVKEKYATLKSKNTEFFCIDDKEYPDKLKNIKDYPFGIYYRGNSADIMELNRPSVAIVGARNCTSYGRKIANDIGFEMAANGINVVSGLARGIDAYGLWGAVDATGYVFAVMGCGADICYPRDNIELYERVMESGGIISDYPLGTEPVGWRFPLRNRIISGLVDKIIVVEAKEKSGSLITVEYGLEQGKDIFAVPGRVGDALSSGCNRLIKDGAGIVISPKDIIKDMNIEINCGNTSKISKKNKLVLEKDLETLYSCVDLFPKNIQQLMEETGKDSVEIIQKLVKLQMMNLVEEPAKNYYSRKI